MESLLTEGTTRMLVYASCLAFMSFGFHAVPKRRRGELGTGAASLFLGLGVLAAASVLLHVLVA